MKPQSASIANVVRPPGEPPRTGVSIKSPADGAMKAAPRAKVAAAEVAPALPSLFPPAAPYTPAPAAAAASNGRDAAAEHDRQIGEMASGLAHDFRNLLSVIASALRLAERRLTPNSEAAPFLEAAQASIARGVRLSSRLLTLAKPAPEKAETEQATILIDAIAPFLRYAVGPAISVRLALDNGALACRVPVSGFNAVMLNLAVNARDAMPAGGEILIETVREIDEAGAAWLRVSIGDQGEGMDDATLARIFEPWFTRKETGTGLGLPQVRAFVAGCGGRVAVDSRIGEGTTFHLLFPVQSGGPALARMLDHKTNVYGSVRVSRTER